MGSDDSAPRRRSNRYDTSSISDFDRRTVADAVASTIRPSDTDKPRAGTMLGASPANKAAEPIRRGRIAEVNVTPARLTSTSCGDVTAGISDGRSVWRAAV